MRIGIGYDVHAFEKGRQLILGGVQLPFEYGLAGHSDADVLMHALADALLGALALGDIGKYFPDHDPRYKNIDSGLLLAEVVSLIHEKKHRVHNVDAVICAEVPKMSPFIEEMRQNIARHLQVDVSRVGVKATTTEKLGFIGREEGIAVQAVALLEEV